MNITCCKLAALFIGGAFAAQSTPSFAVPYGGSAAGTVTVAPCSESTLASIPITVDVSSRIYTSATGFATNLSTIGTDPYYNLSFEMHLRDAADTTDISVSRGEFIPGINEGTFTSFGDNQVLTEGANAIPPGNYLLKFEVHNSSTGCAGQGMSVDANISYILLSSALDRIFADGFAMLPSGRPDGLVS